MYLWCMTDAKISGGQPLDSEGDSDAHLLASLPCCNLPCIHVGYSVG